MILITHIIVAFAGIGLTTYAWLCPSKTKLGLTYGAVGLTLLSGVLMVWQMPSHMLQGCISGLLYVGIASIGIVATHVKLAHSRASSRDVL